MVGTVLHYILDLNIYVSWSASELRVRLVPLNRFKPSSKIFYWPFQGGTSFVDLLCFCSVLCLLCHYARLFTCALWSPAGKGLTSWLSFVVPNCEFVTFPLVSWVRCGTWLYRYLIFAPLLTLKHVSCTSALCGYIVSILSFIRNSLVPKSEHLYFSLLCKSIFFSMCSCDCQNMVKKALSQVSVNRDGGHFIELNAI